MPLFVKWPKPWKQNLISSHHCEFTRSTSYKMMNMFENTLAMESRKFKLLENLQLKQSHFSNETKKKEKKGIKKTKQRWRWSLRLKQTLEIYQIIINYEPCLYLDLAVKKLDDKIIGDMCILTAYLLILVINVFRYNNDILF